MTSGTRAALAAGLIALVGAAGTGAWPARADVAATKAATRLTAEGVIMPGPPPKPPVGRLTAHLVRRSNGHGVHGRLISFRIDRHQVCAVRTAADGSAVCMITDKSQQEAAARDGFDAYFRGDATFKPSTAHGDVGLAP